MSQFLDEAAVAASSGFVKGPFDKGRPRRSFNGHELGDRIISWLGDRGVVAGLVTDGGLKPVVMRRDDGGYSYFHFNQVAKGE